MPIGKRRFNRIVWDTVTDATGRLYQDVRAEFLSHDMAAPRELCTEEEVRAQVADNAMAPVRYDDSEEQRALRAFAAFHKKARRR